MRAIRVSPRDARYLETEDAKPFVPVGLNMIAPGTREEGAGLAQYEAWLKKLAASGGNFVRIWLSSPFWDVEHQKSGVYDEVKARRIDAALAMARRLGIRVKLTLEHFRAVSPAESRQTWAVKALHHVEQGGTAANTADFFNGAASRERFKKKLDWYAARYGDDPVIFGWELWNEVNAVAGGDYLAWTEAMLPELHRRFPRTLCMQSLGSFDAERWRPVYHQHSRMPGNDLAQVHRYLDLGAKLPVCHGPMDVLAAHAVRTLAGFAPGRPILLAEGGAVEPNHSGPFRLYAKDRAGVLLHDVLFAGFFAGGAGPGQCWHWDVYVERNDLWHHFGRFARAVRGVDPPAEGFEVVSLPHPRLRIYALRGRKTSLLWLRDAKNDWHSELERGEEPEEVRDAALALEGIGGGHESREARFYDPWEDRETGAKPSGGTLSLPPFRRSLVVRLSSA